MRPIPTFTDLYNSVVNDIETQMGVTISTTGKVFLRAMAIVQAGKLKLYYLTLGAIQKNIFVDTADPEAKGGTLERFGRVKLGRNPFQATAAKYNVQLNGQPGALIKALTTFKSDDDSLSPNMLYILDNDYIMIATNDIITVRALISGNVSKLNIADTLTATQPIANVDKSVVLISVDTSPLDAETIEDYRTATINSYRIEPQGGAASDYRLWSADAQGVKAVYPYAKSGETNANNIFIEATIADSLDGKGTPTPTIISNVEAVVNFDPDTTKTLYERGRKPLTVINYYLPVTPKDVDIIINGYVGLTVDIQNAINAALATTINKIRPFVDSSDILADKNDILDINKIIATIFSAQPGSVFGTINLSVGGFPVNSHTFVDGDIPYLNSIIYA